MKLNLDCFEQRMDNLKIAFEHRSFSIDSKSGFKEYVKEVMSVCLENRKRDEFAIYDKLLTILDYIKERDYWGVGDYQYLGNLDYKTVSHDSMKRIYLAFCELSAELDNTIFSLKQKGTGGQISIHKIMKTKSPKYVLQTYSIRTFIEYVVKHLGWEGVFYILVKVNELLLQFDYVLLDNLVYNRKALDRYLIFGV